MTATLTLREAARILGVSLATLRRRVMSGEIPAVMTPGPFGERWEIAREVVFEVLEAGSVKRVKSPEVGEAVQEDKNEMGGVPWMETPEVGPWSGSEAGGPQPSKVMDSDGALIRALEMLERSNEEVRRLERQSVAFQYELSGYRRALTENAESLKDQLSQAEALAQENARKMAQFEAEKVDLLEKLRLSQTRVEWFEQRVPRWIRTLFRAG